MKKPTHDDMVAIAYAISTLGFGLSMIWFCQVAMTKFNLGIWDWVKVASPLVGSILVGGSLIFRSSRRCDISLPIIFGPGVL